MSDESLEVSEERRIELLRGVKLFASLGDNEVDEAAATLTPMPFKAGEYVIVQGELGKDFFVLHQGAAFAEIKIPDGEGGFKVGRGNQNSRRRGRFHFQGRPRKSKFPTAREVSR